MIRLLPAARPFSNKNDHPATQTGDLQGSVQIQAGHGNAKHF
jgi:hypothetical protein